MTDTRRCSNPKVVVTRELPDAVMNRLEALFDTRNNRGDAAMGMEDLRAAVQGCDVLVPTVTDAIDAELIGAAGPRLKLIANFGAGVNHIDLKAARARGIIVTTTPGVLTEDTADVAMALIVSVPRRLAEGEKLVRSGEWKGWSPGGMLGHRIGGKKLGIVGMGRIGQAVALRARAFGLSIHTPRNPDSENLLDARRLGLLGAHVYLINTSRGGIVDEEALVEALEAGRLAGAGLDVWRHEPAIDPRLLALPNVVMTPHMGSATFEGRLATGDRVIQNIRMWADGHRPPDQVLEGWA